MEDGVVTEMCLKLTKGHGCEAGFVVEVVSVTAPWGVAKDISFLNQGRRKAVCAEPTFEGLMEGSLMLGGEVGTVHVGVQENSEVIWEVDVC